MPEASTMKRVARDKRQGKSAGTQAGEFVREEMEHIREGKHGARSAKQAIAIGLSKARRAGVKLPPSGSASPATRRKARADTAAATKRRDASPKRKRATLAVLQREGSAAASHRALSRHAHAAAGQRTASDRSAAARKAARTKGRSGRQASARKAARTRRSAR